MYSNFIQARFDESRMALDRVMGAMQLSGAPVILLANKQVRQKQDSGMAFHQLKLVSRSILCMQQESG